MIIFWKKNCKNRLSVGVSVPELLCASGGWVIRPRLPRCYFRLLLQVCRVRL